MKLDKNDIISMVLLGIFCVIFWNIMDFVYTSFISRGSYSFSVFSDVCLPAVIGVTVGYITALRRGGAGK